MKNEMKDRLLIEFADKGDVELVQALLSAGANVNACKGTALYRAGANGHIECVHELLNAGACLPRSMKGWATRCVNALRTSGK